MQVAVGEDNEADFLPLSINTGLFFAIEGFFIFGFGFENRTWEAFIIQ
jgi:hypothetical protein